MTHEEILKAINAYENKMVYFADHADFISQELTEADLATVLEVRAFDKNSEFAAVRSSLAADFKWRKSSQYAADSETKQFTRSHYLDIDSTVSLGGGMVQATGGGRYHLPEEAAKTIRVEYYYRFDEEGIARIIDWRLAGFAGEREVQ